MAKIKKKGAGAAAPDLTKMDGAAALVAAMNAGGQHRVDASARADGDAILAATLHGCYNASQLYAHVGTAAMIALAPPGMSTVLSELTSPQAKERWYKQYKNLKAEPLPSAVAAGTARPSSVSTSAANPAREPHVYAMANSLYYHLRRSGLDQAVVLRGEAGSSKTLQADLLIDQLCSVSGSSKRDERMHKRVQSARAVLAAFGSAKAVGHNDATRFGSYSELQFSERGKMVGMKVIAYAVERDRVVQQRLGERNFHAFYYLLNSAPPDMRAAFALPAPATAVFPYLNYGALPTSGIDDAGRFSALQDAMKQVGIAKRQQHQVFQLLAAILHLGTIQFANDEMDEQEMCTVRNPEQLTLVARLLEVETTMLESVLTARTQIVGNDVVTQLMTAENAVDTRDTLAKVLYNVLFMWLVDAINKKLCDDEDLANVIGLVDFPGDLPAGSSEGESGSMPLEMAYCNERIAQFALRRLFEYGNQELRSEGMQVRDTPYEVPSATASAHRAAVQRAANSRGDHFVSRDFIALFRGGNGRPGSRAALFQDMFSGSIVNLDAYDGKDKTQIVRGGGLARRAPSMRRKNANPPRDASKVGNSEIAQLGGHMDALMDSLDVCHVKVMFCLRPNGDGSTSFDNTKVRDQIAAMQLTNLVAHVAARGGTYSVRFTFDAFATKYAAHFGVAAANLAPRDQVVALKSKRNIGDDEMHVGRSLVILRDDAWVFLENIVRKHEQDSKKRRKSGIPLAKDRPKFPGAGGGGDARTEYSYDGDSVYSDNDGMTDYETDFGDANSMYNAEISADGRSSNDSEQMDRGLKASRDINNVASNMEGLESTTIEEYTVTRARRWWIRLTWLLTWWIPSFTLSCCGGMKRDDIRMAWREKVAICILILFACAAQLFLIIGFGQIICPRQNILTLPELKAMTGGPGTAPMVGIYGAFYNLNDFYQNNYHSDKIMGMYAGLDVTAGFPRTPRFYCSYAGNSDLFSVVNPSVPGNGTFILERHREFYTRNLYFAQRRVDVHLRSGVQGMIGWDPNDVMIISTTASSPRLMFMIRDRVYDLQSYVNLADDKRFLPADLVQLVTDNRGKDMAQNRLFMNVWNGDRGLRDCMNNMFLVGVVDFRKSPRCLFTNYILVAFSALLAAVIGGKFLAAIQLGSVGMPEEHEKFVIMQVPCYTEGEDSLRRTLDSLSTTAYDDKRKLLLVVCDGNIMGSGNDRPTPRIVLDILGVDPNVDPDPLSFQSLGEGAKQHNMGKVYSGLYEVQGHLVPYLVVVKVGKPSERARPGNRGKRDSQMVLMRFLNKVYMDLPMSPLELEMYHQIKNVIGVNPAFYEYCLMVDADTKVTREALIRLVSVMMHDTKVMGVCGETRIANDRDTWATMIQVYEYYISHHLAKAFESLFGSVTCLPGCFSMYRLRSANKSQPILCNSSMITDYGDVNVDTLHKKNLLHLGEDRYLTTLMLKHFPHMRTVFTAEAKCDTVAPERWNVLLSQRRRWINSTIHNLFELMNISQLCGFCCFSMRFVVFIDLLATLIQPAIVVYLGYLIYLIIVSSLYPSQFLFPTISLILLGVIYGLQAIIFLIKREWQHVGWMIIYLLAIPVFSLFIPVYSFWHMDDFSWGNTRIVVGESGKKQVMVAGEEAQPFDIKQIPHKQWSEYESEMWMNEPAGGAESPGAGEPRPLSMMSMGDYGNGSVAGAGSAVYADDARSVHSGYSSGSANNLARRSLMSTGGGDLARRSLASNSVAGSIAGDLRRQSSNHTMGTSFSIGQLYGGGDMPALPPGFPTDDEIFHEVRRILSTADLSTVTKRDIRKELSALFSVDLTPKKDFINDCINQILAAGQ